MINWLASGMPISMKAKLLGIPIEQITALDAVVTEAERKCEEGAKAKWEALPTFPIRDASSLICPVCGVSPTYRNYNDTFKNLMPYPVEYIEAMTKLEYFSHDNLYGEFFLPNMDCKCSCGYRWTMKVIKDDCEKFTRKLFCSYCGCNYDRTKNETCPGCGGRDEGTECP